jgi:hypothetical protein
VTLNDIEDFLFRTFALSIGISIAVEFDGKGRETDNINGATGLGLIDIDGLDRK